MAGLAAIGSREKSAAGGAGWGLGWIGAGLGCDGSLDFLILSC